MSGYCNDCGNTQCLCKEIEQQEKPTSSCMVDSVVGCLDDAIRGQISMRGQALLQWGFKSNGLADHSVQMPEEVVDQILRWRDQSLAVNASDSRRIHLDDLDAPNASLTLAGKEHRKHEND